MNHSLSGKNVLVTGGTGLVGGHIVERLLDLGAHVFALDIVLRPGSYFDSQNLKDRATLVMHDVRDLDFLRQFVKDNHITHIFHLAAQALVPTALLEPRETLDVNIMGTVNVLEVTRENKNVEAVVVASTDKAYGKDCKDARENQGLFGDHPYDVSKSAADLICTAYYRTYGVPVTVSRFANIIGPGDLNFDRIVPGALKAIIKNEVLEIRSDGKFVRDYIYVKDVAQGYLNLAEKIEDTKGEAFNFSAGYNYNVLDLVDKVGQAAGKKCEYKIVNNQKNEIPFQSLNFEKVEEVLGWKARYTLEQALAETYEWYGQFFTGFK